MVGGAVDAGGSDAPAADQPVVPADAAPADAGGDLPADAGPPPDLGPMELACARYAEVYCDKTTQCNVYAIRAVWGDVEGCRERTALRCLERFGAPGSSWNEADQDRCNEAIAAGDCVAFLDATPVACRKAGVLPTGAVCGDDRQCQGSLCRTTRADGCGKCAERQPAGARCSSPFDCEIGLYCSNVGMCTPYRKPGESCDRLNFCQPLLACIGMGPVAGPGVGICQKERAAGEPCDPTGDECASFSDDLDCKATSATTGICQHGLPAAGTGERCGFIGSGDTFIQCAGSGGCEGPNGKGVCVPPLADGAPCKSVGLLCRPGAHCREGVCRVDDPALCQ